MEIESRQLNIDSDLVLVEKNKKFGLTLDLNSIQAESFSSSFRAQFAVESKPICQHLA